MSSQVTQAGRFLQLKTPFDEDTLLLTSFAGQEEMSRLFKFQLSMISDQGDLAAEDIVGKPVSFSVLDADTGPRAFSGFVSRFSAGSEDGEGKRQYRAEVVPWLWFLTKRGGCRIFQDKTVPEIIEQVFTDAGMQEFDTSGLRATYTPRTYCVQYRQSDFEFVSRLMEEVGIFYFFRFDAAGEHKLMLADDVCIYEPCEPSELPYFQGTLAGHRVTDWNHAYEFITGRWAHTDYNFETPEAMLFADTSTLVKLPGVESFEQYEYPGEYAEGADGEALLKVRMEAEEARFDVVEGTSTCPSLRVGGTFGLAAGRHYACEEGAPLVLVSIRHDAVEQSLSQRGGAGNQYANHFRGIPDGVIFRPARTTKKPIVQGPQTAVVVGPSGEEIHTDEYGRIKVQFHWDREGTRNENSSCWVRVTQAWAGRGWGAQMLPRIGQEVVVEFLEGNPDRPLVTGSVYNANVMPPYDLPANKTQTGLKSRSSKQGGPENFNEIRFEDKKGSEQVSIHAEKDMTVSVENNDTKTVGGKSNETVEKDKTVKIVKGNYELDVQEGTSKSHFKGDSEETFDAKRTVTVTGNLAETFSADKEHTVTGQETHNVDAMMFGNYKERVTNLFGPDTLTVNGDLMIEVAGGTATIKVGGSQVVVSASGVEVTGPTVTVTGSSMLELKGGVVKINC